MHRRHFLTAVAGFAAAKSISSGNDGDIEDLVPLYPPDLAVQRKLLVTNPERLFKFSDSY
jgi:hypothetical protein